MPRSEGPTHGDMLAFGRDLASYAAQRGVTLSNEEADAILRQTWHSDQFHPVGVQRALEMTLSERPDPDDYGDDFDYEGEPEEETVPDGLQRLQTHVEIDLNRLQERLGRKLTKRETVAYTEEAITHAARFDHVDPDAVANSAGIRPWSEMDPGEQARVMAEGVRDSNPEPDPTEREYDMDKPADVNAYMVARVNGMPAMDTVEVEFEIGDD